MNNIELVMALHHVWNSGDLDLIDNVYARDFLAHWPASSEVPERRGIEGIRFGVERIRTAFPDWHEQVEDVFGSGDRVACVLPYGGAMETVAVHPEGVFPLPDALTFEQGAAIPMNYLTAHFALAERAGLREGETVLVHGGAGGVGTATIQVAKGYGARTIAVVSTAEKAAVATRAGADETVLVDGFRDAVRELTGGAGVDVVVDVVGGDLMTDSLRSLGALGRLLVVGFTGGTIPEVRVNRLLLNNVDVRGVGWGAYAMARPGYMRSQWDALLPMMTSGVIAPPIGDLRPVEEIADALTEMDERRTLGKTVLRF